MQTRDDSPHNLWLAVVDFQAEFDTPLKYLKVVCHFDNYPLIQSLSSIYMPVVAHPQPTSQLYYIGYITDINIY